MDYHFNRMPASGQTITRLIRALIFPAIALLLLATPAWAGEDKPWLVEEVRLEGFEHLSRDLAEKYLETKASKALDLAKKEELSQQKLRRDRRRLETLLKENGFFAAKVEARVKRHMKKRTVSVTFFAKEGPPFILTKVELSAGSGEEGRSWVRVLSPGLPLKTGSRFSMADYQAAKQKLRDKLDQASRPLNTVLGQVQVFPGKREVVVVLQASPGPPVFFGSTRVEGNLGLAGRHILAHKTYAQGQPFAREEMERTQQALLRTGFFAMVALRPQFQQMEGYQVPILVQVRERQPHSIRLGVGWGTDDLYRFRIVQVNRNLLGMADTLTFEGKVSAIYEGLVGRLDLPRFPFPRTSGLMQGGLEQNDNEAFVNRRLFFSPGLGLNLPGNWGARLGYNLETDQMRELKTQVPDPDFEKQTFFISSALVEISYDTRDSPLDTKEGTYMRLRGELANQYLGSDLHFMKLEGELRQVASLTHWWKLPGWYLAGKLKGGMVSALPGTDRVPLIRRFFPGGPDSVRGFPLQRLGPLDSAGKPLGGEVFTEATVELRFPLWDELGGVIFMDAGSAREGDNPLLESLSLAPGVGLRYHTPLGPLRLDLGYQINPDPEAPIPDYQIWLSVGQAF